MGATASGCWEVPASSLDSVGYAGLSLETQLRVDVISESQDQEEDPGSPLPGCRGPWDLEVGAGGAHRSRRLIILPKPAQSPGSPNEWAELPPAPTRKE